MESIITEEIAADIVGFVRDGDTESLMDIFGYSIENVSSIIDSVNDLLSVGMDFDRTFDFEGDKYSVTGDENSSVEAFNSLDDVKFSRKPKKAAKNTYDHTKPFSEQLDDWVKGLIPEKDTLTVGTTPKVLQQIGFNPLPVTINQEHIDYAINGTKDMDHYITKSILAQLPQALEVPVAVISSQSIPSRVVVIVSLTNPQNGNQVIAPFEIDGSGRQNNIRIDTNAITTIFGKSNALVQMKNAIETDSNNDNKLFYWDKKEAISLLQRAGLQLSGGLPQDGFIHSIRDKGSKVKWKFNNVTETKQFKRWFGNSKVVNDDGSPKVVYHGTGADFWTFDKNRLGHGNDQFGAGFYFSSDESDAQAYGNRNVSAYLAIKNPYEFSVNDETPNLIALGRSQPLTEEQTYEVLKRIPNIYDDEDSILGDYYEEYWENGAQDWMIRDLAANEFNRNIGELDAGLFRDFPNELHEALRDVTGHDGILLKFKDGSEFYVPWFPNQIKSATDNIGTFDGENDDIRFQASGEKYEHAYDEDKVSKEYINSVNPEIENAVIKMRSGNISLVPDVLNVTKLSDETVKKISDFVGYDISGYECKIDRSRLAHIDHRHGLNGLHDSSLSDPKDIARIGYVINNSTNIQWAIDDNGNRVYDKQYNDRNNKVAPVFVMKKQIDGTYTVGQVVPDSKKKTLWITSARIEKADVGSQVPNAENSPQLTSKTPLNSSSASTNIISQKAQKVKTENTKYQRGRAAKYDTRSVDEKELQGLRLEVERLTKKNELLKAENICA